MRTIKYLSLVSRILAWQSLFLFSCLVSKEMRQYRRELKSKGECVEVIRPLIDQIEAL